MGRSRGGLTSKIHAVVDTNGLPIRLALTMGEAHDNRLARKLLSRLKSGTLLLAARGYDADWIRAFAAERGRTLRSAPSDATHWSIRSMATATGFSHTTIRRIWTAFGLQPHRSQTFKLSSDPLFVDKVRYIVGLYLSPPNRALVLSVDEKSQIQALDREQPVLPMMPGIPEGRTYSYVRHGTTSPFAPRRCIRICDRQML
jgi:transposase